jgi:putative pyruvate formate lyase activating enzyme
MTGEIYNKEDQALLAHCTLCPRECGTDRFKGGAGYCKSDAGMNIASICIHTGEEPPISGPDGICNIFFSGCNLRCIYCQNYEISRPARSHVNSPDYDETLDTIIRFLSMGIKAVGFVSPSHVVPQVKAIIRGLHERGFKPITVYNTNGYDKKIIIRGLEGIIDVYLPDYKYVTAGISKEFSDAPDYPEVAFSAIKEMFYQKGSVLSKDEKGIADNGILLRHMVLPGHVNESKDLLKKIAYDISTGINISLMSQYHPMPDVTNHPDLKRILYKTEYEEVVKYMEQLGFRNGWVQDMDSYQNYKPDFSRENPFE